MAANTPKRRTIRPNAKGGAGKSQTTGASAAKQTKANQKPTTKLDALISALRAPKGATLTQLMALTGWQMHSVHGVMSGALKKKRGLAITSSKCGDERVYRIGSHK